MKDTSKQLTAYYRSVRRCLHCDRKLKKNIMGTIEEAVCTYLIENPTADLQAIQQHFGTPQQIAAAYIEEISTPELMKKFNVRKTVIAIICAAVALALLMWCATLAAALIENHIAVNGYIETSPIIEIETEETK